jgi:DNA primase
LTVDQLRLLKRYTKNLIACFDGDAAGRKASMRALEVFLEAGLLGRGAFIPAGFDPDTLVRQRGAQAFAEVIEAAVLLVDFFLQEQAAAARGSTDERARAAALVARILGKIGNPFEFDLLARKAASLIGVSEEVLRREAQKSGGANRPVAQPANHVQPPRPATGAARAATQAELGLIAIATRWPEFRSQIGSQLEGAELYPVLREVCASDEGAASLEIAVMNRLDEVARTEFSALVVGPILSDAAHALALIEDYLNALEAEQRRRRLTELHRTAVTATGDEAAAAAQALIALRRESRRP